MSDTKTIVFPESGSGVTNGGMLALLAPLLQQRGVDPAILACMNKSGCGEGAWFMWMMFLLFFCGNGNGFGFGNYGAGGLANMMNNDAGRDLLMSAIQGNGSAVGQLATKLNCDINAVNGALSNLQSLLQSLASQQGMGVQQIINAIQSGNCGIATQLQQGFCSLGVKITEQGYQSQIANCNQTNAITNSINGGVQSLKDGSEARHHELMARLDSMERTAMQGKIDALQETKSTLQTQLAMEHQTSGIQGYVAQSLIPLQQALAAMQQELNAIKSSQPPVATIPYSPVVGVPTGLAMQYGIAGGAFGGNGGQTFWN